MEEGQEGQGSWMDRGKKTGGQEGQRRLGRVEEIRKDGRGWRNEEASKDRKCKEG